MSTFQIIAAVLGAIVAVDTALAQIPFFKSNSTFQLVAGWIAKLAGFFGPQ